MSAGYSGKQLWEKLGYKEGSKVFLLNEPANYLNLLGENLPPLEFVEQVNDEADFIHAFLTQKRDLVDLVNHYLRENLTIWISWLKQSSGVETDITENIIREIVLPLGWVDVKVCAVDETWSGLKFVKRLQQ